MVHAVESNFSDYTNIQTNAYPWE